MKSIYFVLVLLLFNCNNNQDQQKDTFETDKAEILNVLSTQEKAWSNHDLEGFMQGY